LLTFCFIDTTSRLATLAVSYISFFFYLFVIFTMSKIA